MLIIDEAVTLNRQVIIKEDPKEEKNSPDILSVSKFYVFPFHCKFSDNCLSFSLCLCVEDSNDYHL